MKRFFLLVCILMLLLTGCAQPENVPPPTQFPSDATVSTDVTETDPPESAITQTEPQDPAQYADADHYSVCTTLSKYEVEQFAKETKRLILAKNWPALSQRIAYPITLGGVAYEDSAAFAAAPFETQLDIHALDAIQSEDCADMFCNYSGIMMGNGEVWFGEVLREDGSSAGLRVIALHIVAPGQG